MGEGGLGGEHGDFVDQPVEGLRRQAAGLADVGPGALVGAVHERLQLLALGLGHAGAGEELGARLVFVVMPDLAAEAELVEGAAQVEPPGREPREREPAHRVQDDAVRGRSQAIAGQAGPVHVHDDALARLADALQAAAQLPRHGRVQVRPRQVDGDPGQGGVALHPPQIAQQGELGPAVVEEGGDAVLHGAVEIDPDHARPAPVQGRQDRAPVGTEADRVEVSHAVPVAAGLRPQAHSPELDPQARGHLPAVEVSQGEVKPLPQPRQAAGAPGVSSRGGVGPDGLAVQGQPGASERTQAHVPGQLPRASVDLGRPRQTQGPGGRWLPQGAGAPHGAGTALAGPAPGEARGHAPVPGADTEPVVADPLSVLRAPQDPEAEMGHRGEHPPVDGPVLPAVRGPGQGRLRGVEAGQRRGVEVAQHPRGGQPRGRGGELAARVVGQELSGAGRGGQQQKGPGQAAGPHAGSWNWLRSPRPRRRTVASSPTRETTLEGNTGSSPHSRIRSHVVAQLLLQLQGIRDRVLLRAVGAGAEDRLSQLPDQGGRHRVVGDADAHRLLAAAQQAGGLLGGGQNEGVGAGQQAPQDPVGVVGDPGVAGDVVEVGADEGHGLAGVAALDAPDALHRALVGDVAAEAVDRVGGVDDDAAAGQDLHGAAQVAPLEAPGIDGQHVGHEEEYSGPCGSGGRSGRPASWTGPGTRFPSWPRTRRSGSRRTCLKPGGALRPPAH